jgi:undecaprenyl-diphosphatase
VTYTQAVVLGLVQGLTEFLPISSSGHLVLIPRLLGWPDQGLAFDAVTHLGTLAALLAYFRAELLGFASGGLSRRLAVMLLLATLPAGLVGALLGPYIEVQLRSPAVIAATTALFGLLMGLADQKSTATPDERGEPLERVRWSQGIAIGFAQAIALIPGTSRSGISITAGLFAGLDRATAARYAFLLGIPITAAAGSAKLLQLLGEGMPSEDGGPLIVAVIAAFTSGWAAVWFLVTYLKRRSLVPFVVYRLVLAAAIIALVERGVVLSWR